jgi:hypothetical protein
MDSLQMALRTKRESYDVETMPMGIGRRFDIFEGGSLVVLLVILIEHDGNISFHDDALRFIGLWAAIPGIMYSFILCDDVTGDLTGTECVQQQHNTDFRIGNSEDENRTATSSNGVEGGRIMIVNIHT